MMRKVSNEKESAQFSGNKLETREDGEMHTDGISNETQNSERRRTEKYLKANAIIHRNNRGRETERDTERAFSSTCPITS